ncbi:MBL fold metallo-hydrolase [Chloroflexi bacterium TSY]|nr:MBL fold metallo-hydrolase [Chloroflexi bacterium TSY]
MSGHQLSDHLYFYDDTCSVYLIQRGHRGLLIDCGTDLEPADVRQAGVDQVEQLLLTHFHRDSVCRRTKLATARCPGDDSVHRAQVLGGVRPLAGQLRYLRQLYLLLSDLWPVIRHPFRSLSRSKFQVLRENSG